MSDLLVVKGGSAFMCARRNGEIPSPATLGEGLYVSDTRILSELRLRIGGRGPLLLSHSVPSAHEASVDATNPALVDLSGTDVPANTLSLRRSFLIDERLHLLIELRSFRPSPVETTVELWLGADFADLFEVRGLYHRDGRRAVTAAAVGQSRVVLAYEGEDGVRQETIAALDPPVARAEPDGDSIRLHWEWRIAPHRTQRILATVGPAAPDRPAMRGRRRASGPRAEAASYARTARALDREASAWLAGCTQFSPENDLLREVLSASARDLQSLMTPAPGGAIPAAGIPWYVAPFGRDSLLTAEQSLLLDPAIARGTLTVLAALQARTSDPLRDAEPGKIPHELRSGELARANLIPHTPYYGSVDATPLFVMLAGAYYRWTADLETLEVLMPEIDAALGWIDDHGDLDGDGFIEYHRRSPGGLRNQGWKDSDEAIVHADGESAEGPIALVEVQGYTYLAKLRIAEVYDAIGQPDRGRALRAEAAALRSAFNDAFWNPSEGTFALALDGRKRQVASVTSNPGHCLYCGIIDEDKARLVAERLMAADMFNGWGIRTLSARSPAYNPMSYHTGSIWPHDNAIIAAGLRRYGYTGPMMQIARGIFEIAVRAPDHRLAELYCGFARKMDDDSERATGIVSYPVACTPQAWAAAAPFMLLGAILGLTADAPRRTLSVTKPTTPPWLGRIVLERLRVGDATVHLAVARERSGIMVSILDREGELTVVTDREAPGE